jgi:hypothetical protein
MNAIPGENSQEINCPRKKQARKQTSMRMGRVETVAATTASLGQNSFSTHCMVEAL